MGTGINLETLERIRKALVTLAAVIAAVMGILNNRTPAPIPPADTSPPINSPKDGKPQPQPDTLAAIGKIQFGNAGCTATVIGPRRPDGRWNVLTAAHCVEGQPATGSMTLRDGRSFGIIRVVVDAKSDCCWCVTIDNHDVLPFALLSDNLPLPGQKVWHAGYGVHVPGNRENGTVVVAANSDGQTQFRLSVSSGDSGGGIALDENNRILSTVCCTTNRGGVGDVWGASVESIRRLRDRIPVSVDTWTPIQIPLRMPANETTTEQTNEPGQR